MPITTKWYLEPRILLQEYEGDVSLEDVQKSALAMEAVFEAHTEKVYTIIDVSRAQKMPTDIRAMARLAKSDRYPSQGEIFNFGLNPVSKIISVSVMKVANIPMNHVSSLEEALKRIQELDPSIARLLDEK